MKIKEYLNQIQESICPPDLHSTLVKYGTQGTKYGKSTPSLDIDKIHNSILVDIKKSGSYQYKRNKDEKKVYDASKKTLSFIKTKDLKGIYRVANGDFIFYSFKDKNVYKWDHELSVFTNLIDSSKGKIPYKKFIELLKSNKVETI